MNIGVDLRFLEDDMYSHFAVELVKNLIEKNPHNQYNIYIKKTDVFSVNIPNIHIHTVNISNGSLQEQLKLSKIFSRDKNSYMIFFNHFKPIWYKWDYYTIISGLKDIFYQNFSNYFEKYSYLFLLEKNLKNSKKVLCFDENTKDELIERFDFTEEKISVLPWFFIANKKVVENQVQIDIVSKYGLAPQYFIYSGWDGIEKNLDRLVQVFHRLHKQNSKTDLVFLWDKIGKNIDLRHAIVESNLKEHVHFIDHINPGEEHLLYSKSQGVIFPSLYESFPFRLSNPLALNIPIYASNLHNISHICEDKIEYFSAISTNSILEKIQNISQKNSPDYSEILSKYNIKNTIESLEKIIH